MSARSCATRLWLGGVGVGLLAMAPGANAALTVGTTTGTITSISPIAIVPVCAAGDITCQAQQYEAKLKAQPQNATPDSRYVPDANGGSFQPALTDLTYATPVSRAGFVPTPTPLQAYFHITPAPIPPPNARWNALEDAVMVQAMSSTEASTGVPWVRNPAWTRNGGGYPITSCQQYVYHAFYDVEQWIDAMDACGNDASCKVKFSITPYGQYSYPPAIDRQTMNDSDGQPINNRLAKMKAQGLIPSDGIDIEPPSMFSDVMDGGTSDAYAGGGGTMPKNAFYVGTTFFVVPELAPVLAASGVAALQAEIAKNQYTYTVGDLPYNGGTLAYSGGTAFNWTYPGTSTVYQSQGFADEWDFHATMNKRTAGMTKGEADEYASRQTALVQALDSLQDGSVPWCQFSQGFWQMTGNLAGYFNSCTGVGKTPATPVYVPMDQGDPDPFLTPQTVASQVISQSSLLTPGLVTPNLLASQQLTTRSLHVYLGGGVSGPMPNSPPSGAVINYAQRAWEILPPMFNDPSTPTNGLNCTPQLNPYWLSQLSADDQLVMKYLWTPVCNVTNAILVEWLRAQANAPSCFTDSNYKCDWSPQSFVERFVNSYKAVASSSKEAEYEYCKRWTRTDGGSFASELAANDPVNAYLNHANLTYFRSLLDSRKAAYDKIMKNVPVKATNVLGTDKLDSAKIGNSMFSGGYDYDLGWTAQITHKNPDGSACEWGGTLNASFDANATVMGITEDLVSAGMSMSAMPNDATHTSSGTVAGHLRLVGTDVFQPFSTALQMNGSSASGGAPGADGSESNNDEKTIPLIPGDGIAIQAGPVTITVNAGVEYGYGANLTYNVNTTQGCQAVPQFGLSAGIEPTANFGVWMTADATVAGFGIGFELQLTLIQLGLPLTANVTMLANQTDPLDPAGKKVTAMDTSFDLDLTLSTMGGQIDIYGVLFGFHVWNTPIVTWNGPQWTVPLFHTPEVKIPLPYLLDVSNTAGDPTTM